MKGLNKEYCISDDITICNNGGKRLNSVYSICFMIFCYFFYFFNNIHECANYTKR